MDRAIQEENLRYYQNALLRAKDVREIDVLEHGIRKLKAELGLGR